MTKIAAVLPEEMDVAAASFGSEFEADIHQAINAEWKLGLRYTDKKRAVTERMVWPIEVGALRAATVLLAWCETRDDFRYFRLDRMSQVDAPCQRYATRRHILMSKWLLRQDRYDD